ncbi:MAG: RNA 2',3'-cyclic phosphodiesterase [Spirochaetales bacterium]|nr:RNA 2',3'-cyclic phosphodiesterase [Spirochaetales bacterium]
MGIRLDDEAREHLARRSEALEGTALRRVEPANYHVTLQFLGSISDPEADSIVRALDTALYHSTVIPNGVEGGLTDNIDRWGAFPSPARPRVVWAGLSDPRGALCTIAESVGTALAKIGFAAGTRPFRPHVTVGYLRRDRTKSDGKMLSGALRTPFGAPIPVRFRSVALIRSEPDPAGARYTDLTSWPLSSHRRG